MEVPVQCPVCGAYSLTQDGQASRLLGVCDVLVVKALEKLGHYIVRDDRSRYRELSDLGRPFHEAHTIAWRRTPRWRPDDRMVDKAIRGAWDVVPRMLDDHGCCEVTSGQVTDMLDAYVHDLAVTKRLHSLYGEGGLAYRFTSRLGLPVYAREEAGR